MQSTLTSILKVRTLVDSAVALKLLRARNLPLIIVFLHRAFKVGEQISIPYQTLILKLADFLEEIEYQDEDDEIRSDRTSLAYDEKAKLYIDRWIDAHFLRNMMDDARKEPLVLLSKHAEKAFQVFELLRDKAFVGAEFKFKDIFNKLRDIVEHASPDKERRLAELKRKKKKIEEEIRDIQANGYVRTYENYQIISRYEEVIRLTNEFLGDFREVEDNFKDITRQIYERQLTTERSKGKLLSETFDGLSILRNTPQGKSFYAFWEFMLNDESQEDLQKLIRAVYDVLEDRDIQVPSRSLRKLKSLLHMAARKVLEKNDVLADKLSREIVAKDQLETRKAKELLSGIRRLAIRMVDQPPSRAAFLVLEGNPDVFLPMERKLGEKPQTHTFVAQANAAQHGLEDLDDLARIYSADLIDKQQLLRNIHEVLQHQPQASLLEVVQAKGLTKGLAELLAYVTLVQQHSKFFINEAVREAIEFNAAEKKYLDLPQIIFTR